MTAVGSPARLVRAPQGGGDQASWLAPLLLVLAFRPAWSGRTTSVPTRRCRSAYKELQGWTVGAAAGRDGSRRVVVDLPRSRTRSAGTRGRDLQPDGEAVRGAISQRRGPGAGGACQPVPHGQHHPERDAQLGIGRRRWQQARPVSAAAVRRARNTAWKARSTGPRTSGASVRRQVESQVAAAQVSAADLANAKLSAQMTLATDYFDLRAEDSLARTVARDRRGVSARVAIS